MDDKLKEKLDPKVYRREYQKRKYREDESYRTRIKAYNNERYQKRTNSEQESKRERARQRRFQLFLKLKEEFEIEANTIPKEEGGIKATYYNGKYFIPKDKVKEIVESAFRSGADFGSDHGVYFLAENKELEELLEEILKQFNLED